MLNGTLTKATESDSDVYIFKREDFETDEELTSDDVGLKLYQSNTINSFVCC